MSKIVCVIPARLNSSRMFEKVLRPLGPYTLLGQVIERAKQVDLFDQIVVAACSEKVQGVAADHGVDSVLTDPNLPNGTMRLISAVDQKNLDGDMFVNWQADEPFIKKEMIQQLISGFSSSVDADIWTLKKKNPSGRCKKYRCCEGCHLKRREGALFFKADDPIFCKSFDELF